MAILSLLFLCTLWEERESEIIFFFFYCKDDNTYRGKGEEVRADAGNDKIKI